MKTNLHKNFKTDPVAEAEGVDFEIQEGVTFRVRRFSQNNPKVKSAMAQYYKPYARQIEMGTLPDQKAQEINLNVFLDSCLVGWNGILDGEGNPIEFNRSNAFQLFKDLPEVFDALWKHANSFEAYKEDVGN